MSQPFIVGIGGTPNAQSSTEQALRVALDAAEAGGAPVELPLYPDLEMDTP